MNKSFILFAIVAIIAVLVVAFLTQDDFRQSLLGTPDKADEADKADQINQEAILSLIHI